jgi:NADPH:quinone reductase-like Zn-dependent oxidoreductase
MGAMAIRAHGGPEVLEWVTVPRPQPADDEALVRVAACGMNHLDVHTRRGIPGRTLSFPHILGNEAVGVVAELGPRAKGVEVGQRVLVSPGYLENLHADRSGWDSLLPDYRILGHQSPGGYGEYVKTRAQYLVPVSERFSLEEWAATPLVFLTAWHMLQGRARIRPGETILVIGAGSGVGVAAIQIARHFGCKVISTVGNEAKIAKAKALGADHVVDHSAADWPKRVKEWTGGRGVDVVVEHVGEAVFTKALTTLASGGRLVTCGATTGPRGEIHLTHLFAKQISVLGSYMGDFAELKEVIALLEMGQLKPVVDRVYSIREAQDAHRRMEAREHFGKIVLRHDANR